MQGYLLVDHGSRRAQANAQLDDMAARVARLRPDAVVGAGHMEIAEPGIPTAFTALVARGATRIAVLPYFLGDGRHLSEDLPRLVVEAAASHPGIAWTIGAALGPHDLLAEILLQRGE